MLMKGRYMRKMCDVMRGRRIILQHGRRIRGQNMLGTMNNYQW
jgi:hypothetical protein